MKTKTIFEFILLFMLALSVVFFSGCSNSGEDDPNPQMNDDDDDDDDANSNQHSITISSLDPESPDDRFNMQPVMINFDYDIVFDDDYLVIAVPYFDGEALEDFFTGAVPVSMGTGSETTFVTISSGDETEVDQIGLLIRNESNTSTIETFLFDVDYTFTDGDDAIYLLRINPESPASLTADDDLDVSITYTFTGIQDLLKLDGELYFDGEVVNVAYGIFGSNLDPDIHGPDISGGTTLTFVAIEEDETYQVDQVRIVALDDDELLFETFYNVDITWNE